MDFNIGKDNIELPKLPPPSNGDYILLKTSNYQTYFNKKRKLPLYAVCKFDVNSTDYKISRSKNNAFRDFKEIKLDQINQSFYKSTENFGGIYFTKGHVLSRSYLMYGKDEETAKQNEKNSFYFTNVSPQVKVINNNIWNDLEQRTTENNVLKEEVIIFSGMFFNDDTKYFMNYSEHETKNKKTLQLPLVYWKIIYYKLNGKLFRIGFIISQQSEVEAMTKIEGSGIFKFDERNINIQEVFFKETKKDPYPKEWLDKNKNKLSTHVVSVKTIEKHSSLKFMHAEERINEIKVNNSFLSIPSSNINSFDNQQFKALFK